MTDFDILGTAVLFCCATGIAGVLWGIGQHWARLRADRRILILTEEVERVDGWCESWRRLSSMHAKRLTEISVRRSASASHARQCQVQQQRAKVLAKAAELRGEG